jgi:hypothetical protein
MTLKIQPRDRGLIYACIDAQGTGFDTVKSDTACPTTRYMKTHLNGLVHNLVSRWAVQHVQGSSYESFTYLESLSLTRNLPSSKRTVAETGHPDRSAGRALRV